jgi:hypothetical protein
VGDSKCKQDFGGETSWKTAIWKPRRRRLDDNIKMTLSKVGFEDLR